MKSDVTESRFPLTADEKTSPAADKQYERGEPKGKK